MENEEGKGSAEPGAESSPAEALVEAEGEEGAVEAAIEAEGLEYRGALIRLLAFVIDIIALLIIATILSVIFGTESTVATYLPPVVGLIYFVGFWSWRGQTPGKMVIRAKIVKSDGSTIGFGNAILRYLFYLVPLFAPILFLAGRFVDLLPVPAAAFGLIIIGLSSRKRGLHDMIADTCVVDSRAIVLEPYTDELAQPSDDEEA
ncbi:MAG: RDD family protein [Dehalococcoidia bacterium]|nr:MAG: RDD family protein [Dehalococcoidia bacterium]